MRQDRQEEIETASVVAAAVTTLTRSLAHAMRQNGDERLTVRSRAAHCMRQDGEERRLLATSSCLRDTDVVRQDGDDCRRRSMLGSRIADAMIEEGDQWSLLGSKLADLRTCSAPQGVQRMQSIFSGCNRCHCPRRAVVQ